ncbi:hypothetical protein [Anaerotignum sp.]|uniref:hypothetical protein n=1 Tax=Anaerotignum sp. TaxID=2039241 RepID=UPI00289F171F|nr:hypothetical protein [Anaerotignum sp.]
MILVFAHLAKGSNEVGVGADRALTKKTERGLKRYYCDQDSVNAKVKRYDFSVEEVNEQLMGVANLILNAPLDDKELARIKDEITGQASDGWGKVLSKEKLDVMAKRCMSVFGVQKTGVCRRLKNWK